MPQFMRAPEAARYLKENYGLGSKRSLDKLATVGGGPKFHKADRARIYTPEELDTYALARIGPAQSSTAENTRPAPPVRDPNRPRGRPRKDAAALGAEDESKERELA